MKATIGWILLAPALLISGAMIFYGILNACERFEPPDQVILGIIVLGVIGGLLLRSAWRKEDKAWQGSR